MNTNENNTLDIKVNKKGLSEEINHILSFYDEDDFFDEDDWLYDDGEDFLDD